MAIFLIFLKNVKNIMFSFNVLSYCLLKINIIHDQLKPLLF